MAWPFGGLWGRIQARLSRDPRDVDRGGSAHSSRTQAGIFVTPDRALRTDAVWACVRYLTQAVSQLPVRVLRAKPDGTTERLNAHPVLSVLGDRPSEDCPPFRFRETLIGWALLWGNGYAEIERDIVGRVTALHLLHPERVEVLRANVLDAGFLNISVGGLFYRVDGGTPRQVDLAPRDMFHIAGFGDGVLGKSVVEHAAQSIGWAQATELFGASFFGEGAHFGGAIMLPGKGDPHSIKRMRTELEQLHKGSRKAFRWFIGDQGAKLEKMTATPDEAQFVSTMQHQVESIARWFGVPPHKIQHLLNAHYNNVEQQAIEVVVDSITPWVIRFEEECNYKLFGNNRSNFFVKLDIKGLLRGDFKSRQEGLQLMRRNGVVNTNTWRELEDMAPIGPEGDKYTIEANMTTLDKVGQAPALPAPAPARTANVSTALLSRIEANRAKAKALRHVA